jgi:hypothetical protein
MKRDVARHFFFSVLVRTTAVVLSAAMSLLAYVPMRWGPSGVRGAWAASGFPLTFYVNNATANGTPNLATGSNALAAIRDALNSWQSIQTAKISFADLQLTSIDSGVDDGKNLITMADTAANEQIVGGPLGAVALTRLDFNANTGEITESDIILNPSCRFSTNLAPNTYDLQAIVTHEIGHALGCDHSSVQNDTMFALMAPGEFFQRYISADAIAFASATYPDPTRVASLGTVSGRVSSGGASIFGASVTAVNLDRNLTYASLSEPNGSYMISGLVAGRYSVYAEPLDGPATQAQLMVQGTGAYYQGLNTSFRTVFAGEQDIGVQGSSRNVQVNFSVPAGTPTLNIDRMGRGDPDTGIGYLSAGAVVVNPGETLGLWIGGTGTWNVASINDVTILGTGVTLDPARGIKTLKDGNGNKVGISVLAHVAPDAAPGALTAVLRVAGQQVEQVASTGGIVVAPRTVPVQTLYFPYLRASPTIYTGIALANPDSTTPATARISARDPAGALLWSQDAMIPANLTLPGGTQIAQLERQIFNLPSDTNQSGSVTVESDNADMQGLFLTGDFAGTFLDGAEAFTRGYSQLYFVDVLQDANTSTEIHLMNIDDVPATVDLTLCNGDGSLQVGPIKRIIPAGGKIGESVATLFGFSGELHSAHVKASTTDEALAGFELVSQPSEIFGLNALPLENAGSVLYSPQVAVGDLGLHFGTRLNIVNVGEGSTTVTIEILDEDGRPLVGVTQPVELLSGRHISLDVSSALGLHQGQGYARVSASAGGKLLGNVMFGNGDPTVSALQFGAAIPLFASGAQSFLFAHLVQGSGFYTGVAFLAPTGAGVTVEAFDSNGSAKGSTSFGLVPGQRLASVLSGLIPETNGQVGGYVKVTSDQPLFAFEMFGSMDGQLLSAVPPQRLAK